MKVSVITSVYGAKETVQECIPTWFPLPDDWDMFVYDNAASEIDGTDKYLDELLKVYNFTLIRDGLSRSHSKSVGVLLDHVSADWILLLDSDVKLLDSKFYEWVNNTVSNPVTTGLMFGQDRWWGFKTPKNTDMIDDKFVFLLPSPKSWVLLFNKSILDTETDFNITAISNGTLDTHNSVIKNTRRSIKPSSKIKIVGEIGWKPYFRAMTQDVFRRIPDDMWECWEHKKLVSVKWKRTHLIKNVDVVNDTTSSP